jgi:hypothetical protein
LVAGRPKRHQGCIFLSIFLTPPYRETTKKRDKKIAELTVFFRSLFLIKQIDITFLLKSLCDVFEPTSSRNTQNHNETEKKRGENDL